LKRATSSCNRVLRVTITSFLNIVIFPRYR
jgi:hypothetical protein